MNELQAKFEKIAVTVATTVVHELSLPRYQQSIPVFKGARAAALLSAIEPPVSLKFFGKADIFFQVASTVRERQGANFNRV